MVERRALGLKGSRDVYGSMLDGGSNRAAERGLVGRGEDGNLGANPGGQDRPIVSQLHNGLIVIFFFFGGHKNAPI